MTRPGGHIPVTRVPDDPGAYCAMANLRYTQNKFQEAASLFMDCFNKSKDDPSRQDISITYF